ncbi:MAG: hypothetical protein Fur0010_21560 [Bdellovibrio sp.]
MKTTLRKIDLTLAMTTSTLITSAEAASIATRDRVLVVVTELDTHGFPEFRTMYSALEELTKFSVDDLLGSFYYKIEIIADREATVPALKRKLQELVRDQDVKAVDVILSLHGLPNKLAFEDRVWKMEDMVAEFKKSTTMEDRVARILMRKKLRMLYNLSC